MGFVGAQMFALHRLEGEGQTFSPSSDTFSFLLRQELQAEQQQPVHGCSGHPLHRHHKEVELCDPGPAGLRYLMAASHPMGPRLTGVGRVCVSSVLSRYGGEKEDGLSGISPVFNHGCATPPQIPAHR